MTPDLKRKRSRPSNWWQVNSHLDLENESAFPSSAPTNETSPALSSQVEAGGDHARRRRSERNSQNAEVVEVVEVVAGLKEQGKKRARPVVNLEKGKPATEASSQEPRKRGRPPAQKLVTVQEEAAVKKRGRPAQKESLVNEEPIVRKRGRPAHKDTQIPVDTVDEDSVAGRRTRRSLNLDSDGLMEPEGMSTPKVPGIKAGKRGLAIGDIRSLTEKQGSQRSAEQAERRQEESTGPPAVGKPAERRVRKPEAQGEASTSPRSRHAVAPKRNLASQVYDESSSRKRSQLRSNHAGNKDQATQSKSSRSEQASEEQGKTQRPRASGVDENASQERQKFAKRPAANLNPRKRKGHVNENVHQSKRIRVEASPQPEPFKSLYQQLAPKTHRVSRHTIETKWDALPPLAIERISSLLKAIQRPTLVRINDERKRTQATSVVTSITQKLISKIAKGMPFPQGTRNHREDDFDFEKILDHSKALEDLLTPILHSNELLEAELRKEEALLEQEQGDLAELETNAKDVASKWKKDSRKGHSLIRSEDRVDEDAMRDSIGVDLDGPVPVVLDTSTDEALELITKNISGHMDSIESNLAQVEGIWEAIAKSKAAVQATLFEQLKAAQYREVVMG